MITAASFNIVVGAIVEPVIDEWQRRGVGIEVNGKRNNHAVWSDNDILVAKDQNQLQPIVEQITYSSHGAGYDWKRGEFQLTALGDSAEEMVDHFNLGGR